MAKPGDKVTLQVWGVFDDPVAFVRIVEDFKRKYGTNVIYIPVSYEEYEQKLIDAFAAGVGPEIQIVLGPPTAVDSEAVILFEPATTQTIPLEVPVLPAVLPVSEMPKALTPAAPIEIVLPLEIGRAHV